MNYQETVAAIHALPRLAKTGGQQRINRLLAALNHPERSGAYVHVTGTNGKGSTANAIGHILQASGLTVGLFTSPYIMRFNERFQIDATPIDDGRLVEAAATTFDALKAVQTADPAFGVTEFEFISAMAFVIFKQAQVDVAVIEVGIGGDTDATNVITPLVSVITSVGLDHAALLGDTLASVATHKAGIIKPTVTVVTTALPEEALTVVAARVAETHSPWLVDGRDFRVTSGRTVDWGQTFTFEDADGKLARLRIPLVGIHQVHNAGLAIATAKIAAKALHHALLPREIRAGLNASTWPARLERISEEPLMILDGAHNPQGVTALLAALKSLLGGQPTTLIVGMLADKATEAMWAAFAASPYRIWAVPVPDNPRAAALTDVPTGVAARQFASWQEALAAHLAEFADEPLVVTGSLYLVSAVRQTLLGGMA